MLTYQNIHISISPRFLEINNIRDIINTFRCTNINFPDMREMLRMQQAGRKLTSYH